MSNWVWNWPFSAFFVKLCFLNNKAPYILVHLLPGFALISGESKIRVKQANISECSDIWKVLSGHRAKLKHLKVCAFSHFQFQRSQHRVLLNWVFAFLKYEPLVKNACQVFLGLVMIKFLPFMVSRELPMRLCIGRMKARGPSWLSKARRRSRTMRGVAETSAPSAS